MSNLYGEAFTAGIWADVDSAMSDSSTNAVQNKVIKAYVDNQTTVVDSAMSSSSTNPVQNKVINTELSQLNNQLTALTKNDFSFPAVSDSSSTGWRLNESDGLCTRDADYVLYKFIVTAGQIVRIISDDRFQFQTVASVPASGSSNRVGETYGTGEYLLEVPETATYLIISTPTSSNAVVYFANYKSILGDIATVESSTTASKNYVVGEYLVLNGVFYKVTVAIAQNGTITPGTNCDQTDVGTEMETLNNNLTEQHYANTSGAVSLSTAQTYTVPCDGIVRLSNSSSQSGYVQIRTKSGTSIAEIRPMSTSVSVNASGCCFVRNGMLLTTSGSAFASCTFAPLDRA